MAKNPFEGRPVNHYLRFRGTVAPRDEKSFVEVAPWPIKIKKIICWHGDKLLLKSIKIGNVEQFATNDPPLALIYFVPQAIATHFNMVAIKGEPIEVVLINPTVEIISFNIELREAG